MYIYPRMWHKHSYTLRYRDVLYFYITYLLWFTYNLFFFLCGHVTAINIYAWSLLKLVICWDVWRGEWAPPQLPRNFSMSVVRVPHELQACYCTPIWGISGNRQIYICMYPGDHCLWSEVFVRKFYAILALLYVITAIGARIIMVVYCSWSIKHLRVVNLQFIFVSLYTCMHVRGYG